MEMVTFLRCGDRFNVEELVLLVCVFAGINEGNTGSR